MGSKDFWLVFEKDWTMKLKNLSALLLFLPLASAFYGCTTTERKSSEPTVGSSSSEKRAASEDRGKAARKISQAIGEEPSDFSITSQQQVDAPTGYDGTEYTVKTKAGKTYKCEILEPSGLGKVMTWGMASGASAMCTDFTKGSKDKGKTNKASCNALLQAAGKC